MKIYRNGIEIQDIIHSDRATERRYLMDSHSVNIEFELSKHFQFLKGDNININGVVFSLPADYIAKHNQITDGYKYQLEFFSREERWKDFVLKFDDMTDFPFTATGTQHLKLVSDNLSDLGLGTFSYTSINEVQNIDYKDISIFGALGLIAETYGLEWWISDDTINLGLMSAGLPYPLEYSKELKSIDVSKSSEKLITRLYAYGGTKNMASGKRLTMTVPYIDITPELPQSRIVEGVKYFDDIFPKQKNTITDIETYVVDAEDEGHQYTTVYKIKDANVTQLTQDDLLPEPLMINFTSGLLIGREFELSIGDDGYYEIIYVQDGDIYYPNPTLKPQVGDEYFLSGFKAEAVLPGLVTIARAELLTKATEALQNIGSEYVYDVTTNPIYCEQEDIDLNLGRTVSITSPTLGEFSSRIRGYEKNLLNKYDCRYQIGDSGLYSRIGALETRVEQPVKVVIDDSNTREIKEVLKKFFLSKINPDAANGLITFLQGLTAKELRSLMYAPGLLGEGYFIDENGNATFDSITARKFLEVPELRFNRTSIYTGIRWDTFGGGIIESVEIDYDSEGNELQTGTITLKLPDGDIGAVAVDDLCQGIFHNFEGSNDTVTEDQRNGNFRFAGFNTSYFRITEILESDNSRFRYTLRGVSENWTQQHHPSQFMHFAGYSNPTNPDRQASSYTTPYYTIRLRNMTTWEYGQNNIYEITGKLDGFEVGGEPLQGHGTSIENMYFSGYIREIKNAPIDLVIHDSGDGFLALGESTTLTCKVTHGWNDITDNVDTWSIIRESGNQADDNVWNINHTDFNGIITLTHTKAYSDLGNGISTMFTITAKGNTASGQNFTRETIITI